MGKDRRKDVPSHDGTAANGDEASDERSRFAPYLREVPQHGQTSERVVEILREAILDGVLPPSYWLREKELARELAVSRTPVREALRHLSIEGMVVITTHQGAMVAPISIDDVLQVYSVRETLEGLAARLAARNRSESQIEQMEHAIDQMRVRADGDAGELARLNIEFHKVLRQCTRNHFLQRFLEQIEYAVRRFHGTTYEFPEWVEKSIADHQTLLDAIKSKDAEQAKKVAENHMRQARRLRTRMMLDE